MPALDTIRKRLAALEAKPDAQSLSGRIAELLPDIEQAIARGVSYAVISESLTASGISIAPATLKTYLYRLRSARRVATDNVKRKSAKKARP
ncbi:hypothetical protein HLB44_30870 [Aquincola sp. S2]|uniref:Uncharacterized protein n=1 Tax=Pseudaquabacterium terrae TaxID=2732868 RepID=A0ABX2ERY3_9BURK|nr:hypothetical protein [Aquabacterium terrae]NRF71397.1 hypothetical protein [Aquabacterium terrae]